MFAKLDSWDFICIGLIIIGLWLVCGGAKSLAKASPDKVHPAPLVLRGLGAIAIGTAYLVVHYFVLKG